MARNPRSSGDTDDITDADTPALPAPASEDRTPLTRTVTVGAGRTVMHQVQVGEKLTEDGRRIPVMVNKVARPGEQIEVSHHDAAMLHQHGFLHTPAPAIEPIGEVREDPRPTINGEDGTLIRPRS